MNKNHLSKDWSVFVFATAKTFTLTLRGNVRFRSSRIRTESREIRSISLYSDRMRENADQNNSERKLFTQRKFHQLTKIVKFVYYRINVNIRENSLNRLVL